MSWSIDPPMESLRLGAFINLAARRSIPSGPPAVLSPVSSGVNNGSLGEGRNRIKIWIGSALTHSLICHPHSASSTRRTSAQLPSLYTFEHRTADWFKWSHAVCVHTPCVVRLNTFSCVLHRCTYCLHIVTLDCVTDCERVF